MEGGIDWKDSTCPATGLWCPGKEFLVRLVEILDAGTVAVQLTTAHEDEHRIIFDAVRQRHLDEQDGLRAAVLTDLGESCDRDPCGPLSQTASRFILGGRSYREISDKNE